MKDKEFETEMESKQSKRAAALEWWRSLNTEAQENLAKKHFNGMGGASVVGASSSMVEKMWALEKGVKERFDYFELSAPNGCFLIRRDNFDTRRSIMLIEQPNRWSVQMTSFFDSMVPMTPIPKEIFDEKLSRIIKQVIDDRF